MSVTTLLGSLVGGMVAIPLWAWIGKKILRASTFEGATKGAAALVVLNLVLNLGLLFSNNPDDLKLKLDPSGRIVSSLGSLATYPFWLKRARRRDAEAAAKATVPPGPTG